MIYERKLAILKNAFKLKPLALAICAFGPMLHVTPAFSTEVQEQSSSLASQALEEIVVTARRKSERLQDVPVVVNVVSSDALEQLNLRRLQDIQTIVPGLTMASDLIAPSVSMRGVRFDTYASGANPTVEFYLNDSPVTTPVAMQAMFDVGQIEVLRGPQGTLRGRASPSGSITITTQRPDLEEFGGHADFTATNKGGRNVRGALNIPIIENQLAVRLAGVMEESAGSSTESIQNGRETNFETNGYRASLRYDPTESVSINLMHQHIDPEQEIYEQVESIGLHSPSIRPGDRQSLMNKPSTSSQRSDRTGLEIEWQVGRGQLNYAGSLTEMNMRGFQNNDPGDVFDFRYPEQVQDLGQSLDNQTKAEVHELRYTLNHGNFDFTVGGLRQTFESGSSVLATTPIFFGLLSPAAFIMLVETPIISTTESVEESVFGNVTYQLSDETEVTVGLRHIQFDLQSSVDAAGNTISAVDKDWSETIYSASLKHKFTPNLMGYVSTGSSWRPGVNAVGNFNTRRSALEESFINLEPETSTSYEAGFKSSWLEDRLRFNGTLFYQEFDNYPYRTGGGGSGNDGIFYVSTGADNVELVDQFNFIAPVPVDVYGVEVDAMYQITEQLSASVMFSWSKGLIDDGTVPCNNYGGLAPSIADIRSASAGDNLAACQTDARANYAPLWTSSIQSEYIIPMNQMDAYVRGVVTINGRSQNDPANAYDDISSYSLVDLFAGIRSADHKWDAMIFVKNAFGTEKTVARGSSAISQSYQVISGIGPSGPIVNGESTASAYRFVNVNAPREIGVNVRYNF